MATVSLKQSINIIRGIDVIREFAQMAINRHAESIREELSGFDMMRESDPNSWAKLTMIKAILSPGADLQKNISLAKELHRKMLAGWVPSCYDDVEPIRADCKYGARSGRNITHLVASWPTIETITEAHMTWDGLTALYDANLLPGMASKVRSWALALYDANSRVVTLDVHMLRGMLRLANLPHDADSYGAKGAAYDVLAEMMLGIADDLQCEPLVMQWAMWNEFRHPGKHATHAGLSL